GLDGASGIESEIQAVRAQEGGAFGESQEEEGSEAPLGSDTRRREEGRTRPQEGREEGCQEGRQEGCTQGGSQEGPQGAGAEEGCAQSGAACRREAGDTGTVEHDAASGTGTDGAASDHAATDATAAEHAADGATAGSAAVAAALCTAAAGTAFRLVGTVGAEAGGQHIAADAAEAAGQQLGRFRGLGRSALNVLADRLCAHAWGQRRSRIMAVPRAYSAALRKGRSNFAPGQASARLRAYCGGEAALPPSTSAACQGQRGSSRNARAKATMSACPS